MLLNEKVAALTISVPAELERAPVDAVNATLSVAVARRLVPALRPTPDVVEMLDDQPTEELRKLPPAEIDTSVPAELERAPLLAVKATFVFAQPRIESVGWSRVSHTLLWSALSNTELL